jgi:predicted ATPase
MIADFLAVIPQTPSAVLLTYRPEYAGTLTRITGSQLTALAPLSDSETASLVGALLGSDSSVAPVATMLTERAAGNPFFAAEMVRDLCSALPPNAP